MHYEGLLIRKTPYRERDLIIELLLRSGERCSFYIYGGQGGGKKQKGAIAEIFHMLKVTVGPREQERQDGLIKAQELSLIWAPQWIRENYLAFSLGCFYTELIQKVSLPHHQGDEHVENEGLFSILSNALFYLDASLKQKSPFMPSQHLQIFLVKCISHLGISLNYKECLYCHSTSLQKSIFRSQEGGFICQQCQDVHQRQNYQNTQGPRMQNQLSLIHQYSVKQLNEKYQSGLGFPILWEDCTMLFHYIVYQFGQSLDHYISWKNLTQFHNNLDERVFS